jgi:hypothetical protein
MFPMNRHLLIEILMEPLNLFLEILFEGDQNPADNEDQRIATSPGDDQRYAYLLQ